jgi:hypothetical protein
VILTQLEFNLHKGRTSPSSGLFPHVNSNNCGHTEVGSDLSVKKKPPHVTNEPCNGGSEGQVFWQYSAQINTKDSGKEGE